MDDIRGKIEPKLSELEKLDAANSTVQPNLVSKEYGYALSVTRKFGHLGSWLNIKDASS